MRYVRELGQFPIACDIACPMDVGRMSYGIYGLPPRRDFEGSKRMPVRREGAGASAGGLSWGMCQPVEGVAAVERHALPCSPPRLSFTAAAS
jgi:hypothetical protein